MKILIVGAGRIGSSIAFHLARGGHVVTLVARGKRLEELTRDGAIETVKGERASVNAVGTLDAAVEWDLVMVTVLAHQVEPLLPALAASKARSVMYMFNTFGKLDPLRDAVGAQRFSFAFPNMTAFFVNGKLKNVVDGPGMVTTMSSKEWAGVFKEAGLPTEVQPDMESFLRSHVALIIPLMVAGNLAYLRGAGITWAEAKGLARAMNEAFAVVRQMGNKIIPGFVGVVAGLPSFVGAPLLWLMSRASVVRDLGEFGPAEVRVLIDSVVTAAPERTKQLQAIRP